MSACNHGDLSEWMPHGEEGGKCVSMPVAAGPWSQGGRRRHGSGAVLGLSCEATARRLEELTRDLFQAHDLNGNGLLEEQELVLLNEQLAVLHHGDGADTKQVKAKYQDLFRSKLDPEGRPVPYSRFRIYAWEVLNALDPDPEAQELILEQFVAEAVAACLVLTPSSAGDSDHELTRLALDDPMADEEVGALVCPDEALLEVLPPWVRGSCASRGCLLPNAGAHGCGGL